MNIKELEEISNQVKRDILRMVNGAKSGHPGGALGASDFLTALYFEIMDLKAEKFDMNAENEDVFILSNGHLSPLYYSILARKGYFPISELATFRKLNSRLQGHPATAENLPGIRIASGSLGQGLSVANGIAISKKLNKDKKNVFALLGDGELQEGQNWEAFMFAANNKIDNLIITIDYNKKQIDGDIENVISLGNLEAKLQSFGCKTLQIEKGNDMKNIIDVVKEATTLTQKGQPIAILLHSTMGAGVDFMENDHKWHGIPPTDQQLEKALKQIEQTMGDY